MGRIKSLMVKRAAKQLLAGENQFNEDFNYNKKILGNTMPSKSLRNKIAGYIARLIKAQREGIRFRKRAETKEIKEKDINVF